MQLLARDWISEAGPVQAVRLAKHLAQVGVDAVDAVCLGTAGSGSADMDRFLRSAVQATISAPVLLVVNDAELVLPATGHDEGVAGTGAKAVGSLAGPRAVSAAGDSCPATRGAGIEALDRPPVAGAVRLAHQAAGGATPA